MTGKQHKHLLRDIQGYIDVLSSGGQPNFGPSEFFIESSYINSQNKEMPCYLLTKKGCDMVANKMTGEKGVLFTAAYVTAFEQMRKHIELPPATDKRADAMLLNAKARTANQLTKLWEAAGVLPEYQALALSGLYQEEGINLPGIALQHAPVTYDKTTIAEKLGIKSKAQKPHPTAVGAIISQLELSPDEVYEVPYYKHGHDGISAQYTQSVIDKVRKWLEDNNYPTLIESDGKSFSVFY